LISDFVAPLSNVLPAKLEAINLLKYLINWILEQNGMVPALMWALSGGDQNVWEK
jgi:hypothetical protein